METTAYSPDLIPGLFYSSAREGVEFLKRAFGFEEHLLVPGAGDSYAHVELRLGRGILMCGDAPQDASRNWKPPSATGGEVTGGIYVAVPDVDARYERARAAGAQISRDLHDTEYGSRDFAALDPTGNRWSFGTYHPLAAAKPGDDAGAGFPPEMYAATRYADARAAIRFLCEAFGFEERFVVPAEGESVAHSQLRYGSSLFMVASARDDAYRIASPASLGGAVTMTYYLVVDDVDAHFARAVAAGASIVKPLGDTPYGSRDYGARDPEGQLWFAGTYRPKPLPPG